MEVKKSPKADLEGLQTKELQTLSLKKKLKLRDRRTRLLHHLHHQHRLLPKC